MTGRPADCVDVSELEPSRADLAGATDLVTEPETVHPDLERFRLYVVTQATMLASGWFAGTASRGRYEALLHSGLLVGICYAVFTVGGLL